jgi:adenosylcobinamide-GDP ribazoletransferase
VPTRDDWMRRLGPLYGGAVALVHSTPWRWPDTIADEPRSPAWMVALGAPIGVAAWVTASLARAAGLPPHLAAILGVAALTLASAGLIERGLAERVDRWQGQARPTTAAVVTLVFVTALRIAAFASVEPGRWLGVLVGAAMAGRWAAVFLQSIGDPIGDDAGRSLVATPAPAWLAAALGLGVAAVIVLALGKIGIVAVLLTVALSFAIGLDAQRREGALSAPAVATAAAIGEIAVLLTATI